MKQMEEKLYEADSISELKKTYSVSLQKRLYDFAIDVINLLRTMKRSPEFDVIRYQFTKAAT
ncbi:MAG TPA: hypothetical protein ENH26_00915 [Candidatus Wolfebacteria bacterium]|nr:hypothetical protein [Candidatus Wolfebacteria bacterium]